MTDADTPGGRRMAVPATVLGLALLTALTACGSTVQVRGTTASGDALGGSSAAGDALPPAASSSLPPDVSADPRPGPQTPVAGGTGTDAAEQRRSADPGSTLPGTPSTGGSTPSAAGRGVTTREIFVGVATTRDAASFSSSAFGGAADFGDQEAITKAIVADINARGGVLGRRITPVFHDYSTAQVASDPEAAGQSACADWTQDHKVFAVVNAFPSKILNQCLGRAGTLNFLASPSNYGQALFTTYPRLYGPAVMTDERMVPTWIARLVALKYFTGWNTSAGEAGTGAVKVGLLTQDLRQHPLEDLEKRELARHGITVADTYVYTLPTVGRDMAAAVLRFRSNGITHLLVDTGAFGLFPTVAENQGYRPRYGLNSPVFPQTNGSGNPPAQMHGALGTGYLPYGDVDPGHFTKDVSPAVGRCRDLMRKAGLGTSGSAFLIAQLYCESFSTLFNGLAAGGAPNAVAFASGLSSLTSIQSTLTFSERFAPDRRDSAVGQRDLAYQDDCVCFAYTSATIHRS